MPLSKEVSGKRVMTRKIKELKHQRKTYQGKRNYLGRMLEGRKIGDRKTAVQDKSRAERSGMDTAETMGCPGD